MKKKKYITLLLCAGSLLFIRCKEDAPAIEYIQQGLMKGTVRGTFYDNETEFNESFNFSAYAPALGGDFPGYKVDEDGTVVVFAYRYDVSTNSYMNLVIYLYDEGMNPLLSDFNFWLYREREEIFVLGMDGNNDVTLTNLSFDIKTGRFKTDIQVEGSHNTTENDATLEASVDVVLKHWVN